MDLVLHQTMALAESPDQPSQSVTHLEDVVEDQREHDIVTTSDAIPTKPFDATDPTQQPAKKQCVRHECDVCGTSYTERRTLLRHRREPAHLRRVGFSAAGLTCSHCQKSYAREDNLQRHIKEVHEGKRRQKASKEQRGLWDELVPTNQASDAPSSSTTGYGHDKQVEVVGTRERYDLGYGIHANVPSQSDGKGQGVTAIATGSLDTTTEFLPSQRMLTEELGPKDQFSGPDAVFKTSFASNKPQHDLLIPSPSVPASVDLPVSCESDAAGSPSLEAYEPAPLSDTEIEITRAAFDNISVASVASVATSRSDQSFFASRVPYRSGLSSWSTKRNPRPFDLSFPRPCPLCRQEFGRERGVIREFRQLQTIKDHLDLHLAEMSNALELKCLVCQVGFAHVQDYKWHIKCAETPKKLDRRQDDVTGEHAHSCGMNFPHRTVCTGHHPPAQDEALHADHVSFVAAIYNWEESQLRDYKIYVDEYMAGTAPTNALARDFTNQKFRQSTGSLRTLSTLRSHMSGYSTKSTPVYVDFGMRLRSVSTLSRKQRAGLLVRGTSYESAILQAVRAMNVGKASSLLGPCPDLGKITYKFTDLVDLAVRNEDPATLQLLLGVWNDALQANAIPGHHLACTWYLDDLFSHHLPDAANIMSEDDTGRCVALLLASGASFREIWADPQAALRLFSNPKVLDAVLRSSDCLGVDCSVLKDVFLVSAHLGTTPILKRLLDANLDPNVRCQRSSISNTWDWALSPKVGEAYELPNCECWSALCLASSAGHVEIVRMLLEHGAEILAVSEPDCCALSHAISGGLNIVKLLLKYGADPNGRQLESQSCLALACRQRQFGIAQLLVSHGVDIDSKDHHGKTALHHAIQNSDFYILAMLLEQGAPLTDWEGMTPLCHAVHQGGDAEICETLLKHMLRRCESFEDQPALILASKLGRVAQVRLLVDAGLPLELRDSDNKTALLYAVEKGHQDVVCHLLRCGAETGYLKRQTRSAVLLVYCPAASYYSSSAVTIVYRLIDEGVVLGTRDRNGKTVLMNVIENPLLSPERRLELMRHLLAKKSIDARLALCVKDRQNLTVMDRAKARDSEVFQLLLSFVAGRWP